MSENVQPLCFFVPALSSQYIGDFGPASATTEAVLFRHVLDTSSRTSPSPAVVVTGPGGTGKTTAMIGVGNQPQTWERYSDAVWFISLGEKATPSTLLEELETVVRLVVGPSEAEEVSTRAKCRNKASAMAEAIRVLNDHAVLLLMDDVWADERSPGLGQSTVLSLIQDCLRRLQMIPGRLRVVVSTRDTGIAGLVPGKCRVSAHPFQSRDAYAKAMLCRYAAQSLEEIRKASFLVQKSFGTVLDRCAGLQLALAVAGSGMRTRIEFGGVGMDEVWCSYAVELIERSELLKTSHPDHPAIYAMLESSLKHLAACLKKDGIVLSDEVRVVFSLIGVVKQQDSVPLSVVACIWDMSQNEALQLCRPLDRMHLLSLENRDGVWWITAHDIILDYCKIVLDETPGRWRFVHRRTVEGLERMLLGNESLNVAWGGCAAFWKLGDSSIDMDMGAREYSLLNITRHQMEAGGEYVQRLLHLVTDYRWVEAQMRRSKDGNDLGGYVEDLQTLLVGYGDELPEKVKEGMELLSDAARLSMQYVASNPRELAYQLQARLNALAGQNAIVDRFLLSLGMCAKRPWLKAGKGMLKAAGGAVILGVSLPQSLWCVAVLPNGDDVVVGGDDGYLAVFSIRYASELYELRGHRGSVGCVAVCVASQRIFSCGGDGTVRAWILEGGKCSSQWIVRHERSVLSVAVTANGSRIVFGDDDGLLTVCDSTSGNMMCQWRGHWAKVCALAVRGDEMIVSGSWDGTLGRWELDGGREMGRRIAVGGGRVRSVVVSHDGRRIAYGANEKVGIIDAGCGDVLREFRTDLIAWCVIFGTDDETVHFGRSDGTTAALAPDDRVVSDVVAHNDVVLDIAQCRENGLLVSVSCDRTLAVQKVGRLDTYPAAGRENRFKLHQLAVLPDRKRVLYSWWEGPLGLKSLDVSATSPEAMLSEQALIEASASIGSAEVKVGAIAASSDSLWTVAGTAEGEVLVYDTNNWRPRHTSLRRLRGSVWSVAISNDGAFLAAGSNGGDVALFRLEDGSEVPLPSSAAVQGRVVNMTFSEHNTSLVAAVQNVSQATGMLHVWKHIDQATDVQHLALPYSRISNWKQPLYPIAMMATIAHIATRYVSDSEACIWDFSDDQYSTAAAEEEDDSGLLRLSNREHRPFEFEGALFVQPFGRAIRYRHGSVSEVLGTLEAPICQSFRPEQWNFNSASGLFIAGGFRTGLFSAVLMKEHVTPQSCIEEEGPRLPPIDMVASRAVNNMSAAKKSEYSAFISHAGPDKADIARPLYRRLLERGINTFVDKDELRPGGVAVPKMESAMQTADIGVFITSPDFVCREWPMKELCCFLSRRKEAESKAGKPPVVLPVFYRLNVHDCRSDDLFNREEVTQAAMRQGFYRYERQKEMPIAKVLESLKGLAQFTGIENEEGAVNDAICTGSRIENQMKKKQLVERIVDAVVEARANRDEAFQEIRESRGREQYVAAQPVEKAAKFQRLK